MKSTRQERAFIRRLTAKGHWPYQASDGAPMEGFEYFSTPEYLDKAIKVKGGSKSVKDMVRIVLKHFIRIKISISKSFRALEPYLDELDKTGTIAIDHTLEATYPNADLWAHIKDVAHKRWQLKIGFCKLSEDLIFKGKGVVFPYSIVCMQEMDKDKIDQAPHMPASEEVIRVYKTLGLAVNAFAQWLRETYQIKCQSNHPMGGACQHNSPSR